MRFSRPFSALLLGGSAAALAQVASPPIDQKTGNTMTGNGDMPGMAMPPNTDEAANRIDTQRGDVAEPAKPGR